MVEFIKTILNINGEMIDMDNLPEHSLFCECRKKSCRVVKIETYHKRLKEMDSISK